MTAWLAAPAAYAAGFTATLLLLRRHARAAGLQAAEYRRGTAAVAVLWPVLLPSVTVAAAVLAAGRLAGKRPR